MANTFKYVIEGQDGLSPTVKKIRQELARTESDSEVLGKIAQKFTNIVNATNPVAKKLKQIQAEMRNLQMQGLDKSDLFLQMAQQAGEYKDAVSDASSMVKALSTDHLVLDTAKEAFGGLISVVQLATGAYTMLGGAQEDAQRATALCAGAMSVYNGIQALTNTLNEHGALVIGIKALQSKLATRAIALETSATRGATVAQAAFNAVANMNPYVLLATAAVACGTAIFGFISATRDETEEQQKAQEEIKKTKDALNQEMLQVGKTMVQYRLYIDQLRTFKGSKKEEQTLVKKLNSVYGETFGYYKSVAEWYKVLVDNSKLYCQQLVLEARQRLIANRIAEEQMKQYDITHDEKGNTRKYSSQRKTESYGHTDSLGNYYQDGTREIKGTSELDKAQKAYNESKARQASLEKVIVGIQRESLAIQKQMHNGVDTDPFKANSGTSTNTNSKKDQVVYKENAMTLKEMSDNITVLKDKLSKLKPDTAEFKKTKELMDVWQDRIDYVNRGFQDGSIKDYQSKIAELNDDLQTLNLTTEQRVEKMKQVLELEGKIEQLQGKDYEIGSIDDLSAQLSKINKELNSKNLTLDARLKLQQQASDIQQQIDDLTNGKVTIRVDIQTPDTTDKMQSLENAKNNAQTYHDLFNAGIINANEYKTKVDEINAKLKELGLKPIEIDMSTDALDEVRDKTDAIGSAVGSCGQAFVGLGKLIGGDLGKAINITGLIAQAIGTMISGFATASAQAATLGPIAWLGFGATGIAQLVAMITQIKDLGKGYAYGGTIGGNSFSGDRLLIRANSGERVLTKQQSDILTNKLNQIGTTNGIGTVEFVLRGDQLKGLITNYDKKHRL